jgi:hypothetical protein
MLFTPTAFYQTTTSVKGQAPTRIVTLGEAAFGGIVIDIYEPGQTGSPGYSGSFQRAIIVSQADIDQAPWGCSGTSVGATQFNGTGIANTALIVNNCGDLNTAGRLCNNYSVTDNDGYTYEDWYLPTWQEHQRMFANRALIPAAGGTSLSGTYWSSTQELSNPTIAAYTYNFTSNNQSNASKTTPLNVRPLRFFEHPL